MTPFAKLLWFERHAKEIWSSARYWVGLKDFLLFHLTANLVTEISSASGTGLLDLGTGTWSPLALEVCHLRRDHLPEILAPTSVLRPSARVAADLGIDPGTPVVVGAADGPLANLGANAIAPGVAGLSLGTSGALRVAVKGPHLELQGSLFCYALSDPLWVVGGATSNGADVQRWAAHAFGLDSSNPLNTDENALKLASSVQPGSDGLVMLPFLLPERAPLWDPQLAGAFLGLRQGHTLAHQVRAGIEGVCLQMRFILDRLDTTYPVHCVRATGGAFRSSLWSELMAAALDRPLYVVGGAEGTSLGAAALGLVAIGEASSLEEALDALSFGQQGDPPPVQPSRELVDMFSRIRASIPHLLESLARAVSTNSANQKTTDPSARTT